MRLEDSPLWRGPQLRLGVIDGDSGLLRVLARRLQSPGWKLRTLSTAATPEALIEMRLSALVVDLAVVGWSGYDYLETIRGRLPKMGVVVCTGPSSAAQRMRGLRAGADAWLTKPCHSEELIAVVEATIRHELSIPGCSTTFGALTLRPDLYQAYTAGVSLNLTAKEYQVLSLLASTDAVLQRADIYERVWGHVMARGDRSVDVFVRKLRQKLSAGSPDWTYIHTHVGVGYRFLATPVADGVAADAAAPAIDDHGAARSVSAAGA
jgi:DNA-binding response OmpR family regulator